MTEPRLAMPAAVLDERALPTHGGARLLQARRRIEDGAISVVTLDMFDTIVWRTVPRPTDAFMLLANRLRAAGAFRVDLPSDAFRRLRIGAERRSRELKERRGDGTEVTLDEIWDHFPTHLLFFPRSEAAAAEVSLEVDITRPDLDIIDFADFAAAKGCRLAVVSNTYLSASHLARMLAHPRTDVLRTARIFASSAFGVNKATGLWKIVLDELDVPPDRVLHVGDELTSDLTVPQDLGMHAVHVPRLRPATEEVLGEERTLQDERYPTLAHAIDPVHGDYGLTGLRAKVGARTESVHLPAGQATSWHYGTIVLGPVLTGFASWVNAQAEQLGAHNVRCMMREGEFLADLINRDASGRLSPVPAGPIWLSRAVTAKAIVTQADAGELRTLLDRRLVPTVGEYLANLGLGTGEVPELRSVAGQRMDQPILAREVIDTLADSDHLRLRIVAESTACRHRLLGYLRPLLADDGDTTVLVDLGWGGTIQWQLQRALRLEGLDHRLIGLYLATSSASVPRTLEGLDVRGYLINSGEPFDASEQIGRSPEIIEQSCLSTCGSLVDFTTDAEPVLDDSVPPPAQVTSKIAVQHGVRAFQREWLRYATTFENTVGFDGGERPHLLEILRRSVAQPTAEEARTFGAWTHDDNFGVDRRDEVIAPRLGAYVPYLSPADLTDMTMADAFWPLGLAAEYDPSLAALTQAILMGHLGPEDFAATRHPATVSVSVDLGSGWGSGQSRPLRINRNGLSYVGFDVRAPGIRSVRFDPCDCPAIFRIDWIELGLHVSGHDRPQRIRFEGAEALGALTYAGCRWLYDGVAIGDGDHCEVHIPLDGWPPGAVYGVEVSVAMAVLPLPPDSGGVPLRRQERESDTSLAWALDRARVEVGRNGVGGVARGAVRFARRRLG